MRRHRGRVGEIRRPKGRGGLARAVQGDRGEVAEWGLLSLGLAVGTLTACAAYGPWLARVFASVIERLSEY